MPLLWKIKTRIFSNQINPKQIKYPLSDIDKAVKYKLQLNRLKDIRWISSFSFPDQWFILQFTSYENVTWYWIANKTKNNNNSHVDNTELLK